MKSTMPTRLCHFWIYVLMALVIFQQAEFAYSQPFSTMPIFSFCGADFDRGAASVCQGRGYRRENNPAKADLCCTQGCTYLELSDFCNSQQPPVSNRPRYVLCGNDFNTALDSLCVNFYDISRASNAAPGCCYPGCTLATLLPLCNRQTFG